MVIHANPDVANSPALCGSVRTRDEMDTLSHAAYGLFRDALPAEIRMSRLPIEGFLSITLGLTLSSVLTEPEEMTLLTRLESDLTQALSEIAGRLGINLCLAVSALHTNTGNVYDALGISETDAQARSLTAPGCFFILWMEVPPWLCPRYGSDARWSRTTTSDPPDGGLRRPPACR